MRFIVAALSSLLLAACSAGTGSPAPTVSGNATPTATSSTSAGGIPTASAEGDARVDVTLLDTMKIEPSTMTVPAGQPVTFVVTNAGVADHEFFVGDGRRKRCTSRRCRTWAG